MNKTIANLKKLKSFHNGSYGADIDKAIKALEKELEDNRVKTELKPKAGHWQKCKSMIYCSECGALIEAGYLNDMNYCHNCGCRMEKE